MKQKVAVYCRVSSKGQEDNTSLESQEDMGRLFCKNNGYTPIVFKDASTGANMDREQFEQMWTLLETKDVIGVWFWKTDRLLRDMGVFNDFVLHAQNTGCRVWAGGSEIDLNDVAGFARMAYESVGATIERLNILQRSSMGIKRKYEEGTLFVGKAPYGFERDRKRGKGMIFPVEHELDIVREVFRVFLLPSVKQYHDCIAHLKRTNKDLPDIVNRENIQRWLKNTIYIGEAVNNTKHGKMILQVEPSVDIDTFEKVQEKRSNIGRKRGIRTWVYQLEDKIFCGTCGRQMYVSAQVHKRKDGTIKRHAYYICSRRNPAARDTRFKHKEYKHECDGTKRNKIAIAKLEDNIWEVLFKDVLPNSEHIKKQYEKLVEGGEQKKNSFKGKMKFYEKELKKKQQSLDEMTVLLAEKTIDKVQYKRTSDAIKESIKQTKATLKDVTDEYDKIEKLPKVGDWIEQMKDDLQTKYDIKRSVDKKRLIQKYVDSVFVTLEKDKGLTHKEYKILLLLKITTDDMMLTKKDKQQTYSYQILDSNNLNDISYE